MKSLFTLFLLCQFTILQAQILDPVTLEVSYKKLSNNHLKLNFEVSLEKGWYIYSHHIESGGPIPTQVILEAEEEGIKKGKWEEHSAHKIAGYDPIFEMQIVKYAHHVVFSQEISTPPDLKKMEGFFEYMVCDSIRCLAPTRHPFSLNISKEDALADKKKAKKDEISSLNPDAIKRGKDDIKITLDPIGDCGKNYLQSSSSWIQIFILGFLGGLIALLTPCVFPMIPLTVSFFSHSSHQNVPKALLYGFFIFLIYLLLSVPFHLMDSINPSILNEIATNVWLNLLFFVVFVVFAFSFFGFYELTLPSRLTNLSTKGENLGGILGIFFMALTLSLVSFSCTGPILGSLLVGSLSVSGGASQLTAGMAGFGLALALPFSFFAAFPKWMHTLPKSGHWMQIIKNILGFLELALALKFLSNADMVMRWGFLKYEIFIFLWVIIFLMMALYLIRVFRLFTPSSFQKKFAFKWMLTLTVFGFVVYLISGFRFQNDTQTYSSLKILSGLSPPVGYSWIYPKDCPLNLTCFKNFAEGREYAWQHNKPILLDFTGHACVNCRKMEEHIWSNPKVLQYLANEFIIISLYVDEKTKLGKEDQYWVETQKGNTKKITTVGEKWAHFQASKFTINAQPYYVLMHPDGRLLTHPIGYTPDVEEYTAFLQCGLESFRETRE